MIRKEAERNELIRQLRESGETIAAFSKARGISPSYMYSLTKRSQKVSVPQGNLVRVGQGATVKIALQRQGLEIEVKVEELAAVLKMLGVPR